MSFGSPKPPDPYVQAAAQSQANQQSLQQAAQYNQFGQVTPFGTQTWSGTIGEPDRTVTTTLNPATQALLNSQLGIAQGLTNQAQNRLDQLPSSQFSLSGLPGVIPAERVGINSSFNMGGPLTRGVSTGNKIQGQLADSGPIQKNVSLSGLADLPGVNDFSAERQKVEDALYNRATARLDPRFEQDKRELETRLANQGITQGSDAYATAMGNFGRSRNDAYSSAMNDAILAGGGEQSRMFGLGLQARQQGVGERFGLGEFANQAQAQQFGQNLGAGQFANQAQAQEFGQGFQNAQLANTAAMQDYARNLGAAQFYNDTARASFDQGLDLQNAQMALRNQGINEQILERNQPFNELAAFLGGAPQQPLPQFGAPAQYSPMGVPVGDYMSQNYAARANANASLLSGLFGLGGQVGSAAILACWVAREVMPDRWIEMRRWMLTKAPDWLWVLYRAHGERIAEHIRARPWLAPRVRRAMEGVLV